jgi:hypothetical protein
MTKTRALTSLTVATVLGGSALLGTLVAPTAHADPILDPIAGAVNATRAQSTCSPLNYSPQLEADAQAYARRPENDTAMPGGYPGMLKAVQSTDDPTSKATAGLIDAARPYIKDCKYKDFGVGMVRSGTDESSVAVVLGQGAPPPANNPPPPANNPPPAANNPPPAAKPAPAPKPPTNAVTLSFGPFGLGGLPVTATNSSSIAGTCTYDSTPLNYHHNFNLAPNSATSWSISGLPTGTTYHVVVSCTGDFNGQSVEFGHVDTNKTF